MNDSTPKPQRKAVNPIPKKVPEWQDWEKNDIDTPDEIQLLECIQRDHRIQPKM